ncbi:hypothetical protein ACSBR2_025302 [Camellia fascicularis]
MAKEVSGERTKTIIGSCSSQITPAAKEVIASNEDLLTEILLRVPAKSLIRFKSVSENWLNLISVSRFASNHSRRDRNSSMISGLYFHHDYSNPKYQVYSISLHGHPNRNLPTLCFLDSVGGDYPFRTKNSCNGLLLCEKGGFVVDNHYTKSYIVCNPTTQKFTLLPQLDRPQLARRSYESLGLYLAFDPSKSPHYKVVLHNCLHNCYWLGNHFDIYSSESASWKQIDVSEPLGVEGVFWNGAIHWLSDGVDFHCRFEVDTEKLIKPPSPARPKILSVHKFSYFGECDGHLLLVQMQFLSGFRILQMERDSLCCIVKCHVNLETLISVIPEIHDTRRGHKFRVLCIVKEGVNKNDFALVFGIRGKVIYYNLKRKTLKVFRDGLPQGGSLDLILNPCPYRHTYQFIESLYPV